MQHETLANVASRNGWYRKAVTALRRMARLREQSLKREAARTDEPN